VSSSISTVMPSGAAWARQVRGQDLPVERAPDARLQPRMHPTLGRHGDRLARYALEASPGLLVSPSVEFGAGEALDCHRRSIGGGRKAFNPGDADCSTGAGGHAYTA
jgi:hypothetical protein